MIEITDDLGTDTSFVTAVRCHRGLVRMENKILTVIYQTDLLVILYKIYSCGDKTMYILPLLYGNQ